MDLEKKLAILADAAKYDASCASSGSRGKNSREGKGVGSTGPAGICHSFTPDGRCVSLLKILLTNFCTYDCLYCINRKSSDVPRARFTVDEVVKLTLDFYKRNYIEGLFLSSGIIRSADYTMEQVVAVARKLRVDHDFRGYIHLKTIPEASPELIKEAGRYADRISINVELPTQNDLDALAPEKNIARIERAMGQIRNQIAETKAEEKTSSHGETFAPAGQSTQMIVGATPASDHVILKQASKLYRTYGLKRVYYSAYSPIPDASATLPMQPAPVLREHRLYQSDWLMRFYGFKVEEITPTEGNLDLRFDPKTAWALRNPHEFPVDLNKAPREMLLRIPGVGVKNVDNLLKIRRWHSLAVRDLIALRVSVSRALPFVIAIDHRPRDLRLTEQLLTRVSDSDQQMELFGRVTGLAAIGP